MTRAEHYQRAQTLLTAVKAIDPDCWVQKERDALMAAQVHATLAAAPAEVAGDAVVSGEDPGSGEYQAGWVAGKLEGEASADALRAKLEAALAELVEERHTMLTVDAASFIRERVLGGEAEDPGVDYRADSDRLANLIGRLVRLAEDLEDAGPSHVARRIREELGR